MRNIYLVVTEQHGDTYVSYVKKVSANTNLLSELKQTNLITANVGTKKYCDMLAKKWNQTYHENGTYYLDVPSGKDLDKWVDKQLKL